MGSFYQRWKKHLRFGIIFIATLSFGVPAAMAQQATGSDELLTRDGTRVADFERDTERGEEDQFDQPDQPRPQQVQQPQDPLNELYAGYSSQTIDRRDNERVSRPLRDPSTKHRVTLETRTLQCVCCVVNRVRAARWTRTGASAMTRPLILLVQELADLYSTRALFGADYQQ